MNQTENGCKKLRSSIKNIKSTKGQKQKNPIHPPWSQIPTTVVLAIYTYLGDVDRVSMGRVCKPWYLVFRVSSLWRSRRFVFRGRRSKRQIKKDALFKSETASLISHGKQSIEFCKQFPTSLQEVKIELFLIPVLKETVDDFKEFSACFHGAKLRSVCISLRGLDTVGPQMRTDLIDSLKRLMHNQHCLRKFRIEWARFDLKSGLQFLQRLAKASGATIQDLSLYGFFEGGKSIYREGRVLTEMQKFKDLRRIHLGINAMSEELAKSWVTKCPHLSFIKLCAEEHVTPNHVVSCETWKALVGTHPNLLVELQSTGFLNTKLLLDILSPAIPLFKFYAYHYGKGTTEDELTQLVYRVASYHRTIQHLYLSFLDPFPNLDATAVQNILCKCTNLLPFQGKNFTHTFTQGSIWRLSQQHTWWFQDDAI